MLIDTRYRMHISYQIDKHIRWYDIFSAGYNTRDAAHNKFLMRQGNHPHSTGNTILFTHSCSRYYAINVRCFETHKISCSFQSKFTGLSLSIEYHNADYYTRYSVTWQYHPSQLNGKAYVNKCITWKITISITQPCTSQILTMLVKEAKIEDSSLWRHCLNVIPTFPERMLYNSTGIPITSMCQGRGPNFRLVNYANSRTRHLEWKPGDVISVWEVLYRNIWIFNLLIWFDV